MTRIAYDLCVVDRRRAWLSSFLPKTKWHAQLRIEITNTFRGTIIFPYVSELMYFSSRVLEMFDCDTKWEALPWHQREYQSTVCTIQTCSFVRHQPAAPLLLRDDRNNMREAFEFALAGSRSLLSADVTWSDGAFAPLHLRVVPSVGGWTSANTRVKIQVYGAGDAAKAGGRFASVATLITSGQLASFASVVINVFCFWAGEQGKLKIQVDWKTILLQEEILPCW